MNIIAVTGTAGAGKSTYAKKLARTKKYLHFDIAAFVKFHKLYEHYDRSLQSYVVDIEQIIPLFLDMIKGFAQEGWKGVIFDGHLSHYLPASVVKYVVVVRCDIPTLRKRLHKRGYSKKKIETNIEAEIMETCLIEAQEQGHTVKIVQGKSIK